MAVLLLAEVIGGELSVDATAKTIAAAKSLGDITVLCAGAACGGGGACCPALLPGLGRMMVWSSSFPSNGLLGLFMIKRS